MTKDLLDKNQNNDVLIVDDSDENAKFLSAILIADGYSVRQASSGEMALMSIKAQLPGIILLDIMIPEMDGFEVCRQIKANPATCNIPVIFISALVDEQSKLKGFELGGVDFITKPFRKVEVLARIKNHIHLAQIRILLEQQTIELKESNNQLQTEVARRKKAEKDLGNRIAALTQPLEDGKGIDFSELFDLPEIQKLQDQFADAFCLASIITQPDGTPITKPSNFCRLCNDIIRDTEIGLKNCMYSDSVLGKHNPNNPVIQPCLSGGLWDAGSSITVGGLHVANWLIGQVRDESQNEQELREYARKIGADEQEFMKAYSEVASMSKNQFRKVSEVLFTMSGQLSRMAYQNIQQARFINERKKAEHALFESEEMMRNSQSVAHICSYSTNLNVNEIGTSFWKCSPEFYKIFGIDQTYPHTIEGWAGFIHPDYREKIVAYHEYVIKERISFEHEYKIIRINDGAERWVFGTGKLELDKKGNPIRMHGAIQDITESKRYLETIQNERQLLRTLIDNLPVTIYVKDSNGRKLVANKADLEVIGVDTEAEVLGKTDLETFSHEIGQRGYEDDMKIIQTREPVINREEIFRDKNGSQRWLLTSKIPLIDQQGKTTGIVGIGRDITEQKKATETIQKLSKSIEQSPSTIVITDVEGNIEYVNPKFCEITGYTNEEVIGQNPRILKSGEMPAENYKELWDTISLGEVWRGEFHNRKKNGELYWEWATMTSIKNEMGVITNFIAIKEDISLRKQMEADLIVAKEKAEESDRLKSAFLANMSHEIRTPLNSIIGFSELLGDDGLPEDQKSEFIHHIISNGNNLLNIISDIVDISKIEAREITIRKSKVHVKNLMNEIHSQHTLHVEEKLLQFKSTCLLNELDEGIFVVADKERLQQIFNNLISNALKFTTTGYIEIGCEPSGDMIKFHVKDTGIGIPKAFLDLIFDRFRQVETSLTRKFGGNGLGLAISKNLVELMGGTIWVESETGIGSTFYFTLPATS